MTLKFSISQPGPELRLDQLLGQKLAESGQAVVSREKIKTWIKAGLVRVDGQVCLSPSFRPPDRAMLELDQSREQGVALQAEAGELALVYQDQDLIILNKPPHLTVHPAPSCPAGTLVHRLIGRFPELAALSADNDRPGLVHRLDKDTSGLLLVALNESVRLNLAEAFARRQVKKIYLALVRGCPERPSGEIDRPIGRHPSHKTKMAVLDKGGRPARSAYQTLYADPDGCFSLLAVRIHTGRTHQIRVHLSHMGHPVIGDRLYGDRIDDPLLAKLAGRQLLHAWKLSFHHPRHGQEMNFVCPPPPDFLRVILYMGRRLQRVVLTGLPGCGKSLLLEEFARLGRPVFSADACVKQLYAPGGDGWDVLRRRFGQDIAPDGAAVDKAALLALLGQRPGLLGELSTLIHPLVKGRLELFWQEEHKERLAVAEVPLYFEGGWSADRNKRQETVVAVTCPEKIRRKRLLQGRPWDETVITSLETGHWPEEKKSRAADLAIDNSGSKEDFMDRAKELGRALRRLRVAQAGALRDKMRDIF